MSIKEFYLDEIYMTTVYKLVSGNKYDGRDHLTDYELLDLLKGNGDWSYHRNEDHDKFTELRNELEKSGYIRTQRSFWNGDYVCKPFKLNGALFRKGNSFPCSAAMQHTVKWKRVNPDYD